MIDKYVPEDQVKRLEVEVERLKDKSYQVTVCKKHDPTRLHCAECSSELRSALREAVEALDSIKHHAPYESWHQVDILLAKLKEILNEKP